MGQERAIVIGAGPAGLTAAYELLARTGIKPIVLKRSGYVRNFAGEHFFSTAPMRDLMRWFDAPPPAEVLRVSDRLVYREIWTVYIVSVATWWPAAARQC